RARQEGRRRGHGLRRRLHPRPLARHAARGRLRPRRRPPRDAADGPGLDPRRALLPAPSARGRDPRMTGAGRFGYGTFGLASLAGLLSLATLALAAATPLWVPALAADPELLPAALGLAATPSVLGLLVGGAGGRHVRRVPQGTPGKGRLGTLFGMAGIGAATTPMALAPLMLGASDNASGFLFTLTPADLLLKLPQAAQMALIGVASNGLFDCLVALVALALCLYLPPPRVRAVASLSFDAAVVVAAIAAVWLLPSKPATNALEDLVEPVARLALLSLAILRVSLRLLPIVMGAIERVGFMPLVASRHLRSRKSSFLAAIGGLSILAVALSSCMLTTVLSVMGGFRADLQAKILGSNAHVVVDREGGGRIEGWQAPLERARATAGVRDRKR